MIRPLILLALCTATSLAAQPSVPLPDSPAGRQAAALLRAVQDGRPETVRDFVAGSMNAQFGGMPLEQHVEMFGRMKDDFAASPIQAVRAVSPERIEVTFAGQGGPLTMVLSVEPAPPHRIAGLNIRSGSPAPQADATAAPAALSPEARAAVVDSAAGVLERNYISADTGRLIASHLRARAAAGAYREITAPAALAAALTEDVRAVNGDRHLNVRVGAPDVGGRRQAPAAAPAASGDYRYLTRVEVLPENVGYLRFAGIPGADDAFGEVERALRSLERTDAVIIDLRGSPGGSAQMANFLISHFTRPGALSLAVASRGRPDTTLRRTLADVPGPRRLEVPLYVLIDRGAGSAAEDIPFVLRNLGRATLVGERTAGAGRNNRFFPIGQGLALSVSITRVWDPCTGREWERVGVEPHLEVPAAEALEAALADIRAGGPRRAATAALPEAGCRLSA